jgi:predicted HicB family RNase H-like nuclease
MPKKPKKMGRPPLPKGETKDRVINVQLHPDQYAALSAKAAKNGQTVSQWVRSTINASLES